MEISDHDLRLLVRDVIGRRVGSDRIQVESPTVPSDAESLGPHVSQRRLDGLTSGDPDGLCLIEPTVRCFHCGYCLSFGH